MFVSNLTPQIAHILDLENCDWSALGIPLDEESTEKMDRNDGAAISRVESSEEVTDDPARVNDDDDDPTDSSFILFIGSSKDNYDHLDPMQVLPQCTDVRAISSTFLSSLNLFLVERKNVRQYYGLHFQPFHV